MTGHNPLLHSPTSTSVARLPRRLSPVVVLLLLIAASVWTMSSVDVLDSLSDRCESSLATSTCHQTRPRYATTASPPRRASEGVLKNGSRPVPNNESYTTNLLPDVSYVTHFPLAGFTNMLIGQFDLLHLAVLQRSGPSRDKIVPVLTPFIPRMPHLYEDDDPSPHVGPVLRFSEVFDIDRLAESLGFGIVEWADLKQGQVGRSAGDIYEDEWQTEAERAIIRNQRPNEFDWPTFEDGREPDSPVELLGCWSHKMTRTGEDPFEWNTPIELYYNIRLSSTPLPPSVISPKYNWRDGWLILPAVTNWLFPVGNVLQRQFLDGRSDGEADRMISGWSSGRTVADVLGQSNDWRRTPPASKPGQMTCLEDLFQSSDHGEDVNEVFGAQAMSDHETSPWTTVGIHARWNPTLEKQAHTLLLHVLGLPSNARVPPFFAVHIRRGDFKKMCDNEDMCLSVRVFARHLDAMRAGLVESGRTDAADWPVVVTTDDTRDEFTADIHAAGWFRVDHRALKTRETYGVWAPITLDSVVLSMGSAFLGVEGSTMSAMAARRVHFWHGGEVYMVRPQEE